jgi:heterodisulfide reductase subunit C
VRVKLTPKDLHGDLVRDIETLSEQQLLACNQCGRCSAGCPFADDMDLLPNQIIRLAQLGQKHVLKSRAAWFCAACLTCQTRCPKGVDIPRLMEAIRELALRSGEAPLSPADIETETLTDAPQMAIVGALRKAGG